MKHAHSLIANKTILVIDDDRLPRTIITNILKSSGCNIITAPDVFEGWYLIKSKKPDALILDIVMPYVSGLILLEYICNNPETQHLPCLILSQESTVKNIHTIVRSGAKAFIAKRSISTERVIKELTTIFQHHPSINITDSMERINIDSQKMEAFSYG